MDLEKREIWNSFLLDLDRKNLELKSRNLRHFSFGIVSPTSCLLLCLSLSAITGHCRLGDLEAIAYWLIAD